MPANNLNWLLWFEENPKDAPHAPLACPETPPNGLFVEHCRRILPRHVLLALDTSLRREV